MKKYYLHNGTSQEGPYDLDQLISRGLSKSTSIWYEGLTEWTTADKVEELKHIFKSSEPPPLQKPPHFHNNDKGVNSKTTSSDPKKKNRSGLIISTVILLILSAIGLMVLSNNPNAIPGIKFEINTPKPKITTSRADGSKSGLFKARTTVYATVINQGGDGNVLVTFYVNQDGRSFDRTKSVYLTSNQSTDLDVTFDEVKYLAGDITYNVEAEAQ